MSERVRKDQLEEKVSTLEEEVLKIGRIVKVTKGGRRFRFSVMVVVGDGESLVGFGHSKAKEIPDATKKAVALAKKSLIRFSSRYHTTVRHEVIGKFGSTTVKLWPARPGTGVIAGGVVRAVLSKVGIQDVFSKIHGSKSPVNVAKATLDALQKIENPSTVALMRGKTVAEIWQ